MLVSSHSHNAEQVRELYYRDPNLFRSQATVDRYLGYITRSFGVQRPMLNVVSGFSSPFNADWADRRCQRVGSGCIHTGET
jgi:hypothetical protein